VRTVSEACAIECDALGSRRTFPLFVRSVTTLPGGTAEVRPGARGLRVSEPVTLEAADSVGMANPESAAGPSNPDPPYLSRFGGPRYA